MAGGVGLDGGVLGEHPEFKHMIVVAVLQFGEVAIDGVFGVNRELLKLFAIGGQGLNGSV